MKEVLLLLIALLFLFWWVEIREAPVDPPAVIVVTAVPDIAPGMATAVPWEEWTTAVPAPDAVIISPPVVWTVVPQATATPLPPSTGLLAVIARHGEAAVQRCTQAMTAGTPLDLQCRTIALELNAIHGGQP